MSSGKIIIVTAPSGSGKTTLVKRLLQANNDLVFSISACTRQPRAGETDGQDYYFYTVDKFKQLIEQEAFAEWEMVYTGKYYGTLKSELQRIWDQGKTPLVDIDVMGAISIQNHYPKDAISLFIQAPSMEELRNRLEKRGTETAESLEERIRKAEQEMSYAPRFDKVIINDDLETASNEVIETVKDFLSGDEE